MLDNILILRLIIALICPVIILPSLRDTVIITTWLYCDKVAYKSGERLLYDAFSIVRLVAIKLFAE